MISISLLYYCRYKRCLPIWTHEWLEKINDAALLEKEDFYSHLNMKDITDSDHTHAKRVFKDFEIKHLEEYHDLYVLSDVLLLAHVFENFGNMNLILLVFLLHQD